MGRVGEKGQCARPSGRGSWAGWSCRRSAPVPVSLLVCFSLPSGPHLGIENVENVLHNRPNRLPLPQFGGEALVHRDDVVDLAEHGGDELGAACFVREDVGALPERVGEQLCAAGGRTTLTGRSWASGVRAWASGVWAWASGVRYRPVEPRRTCLMRIMSSRYSSSLCTSSKMTFWRSSSCFVTVPS